MKSESHRYKLQTASRPYDLFSGIGHVLACKAARVVVATCFAIISSVAITSAETVTLYGNIPDTLPPIPPGDPHHFYPKNASHTMAGQPFVTGELGIVSSVSLPVAVNGSPTGVVHFVIWDDNSGKPGTKVASVGDLDLDSWTGADLEYHLVTFDRPVTGLEPNTKYHMGWETIDTEISGFARSWFTRTTTGSEGTNKAAKVQIIANGNWAVYSNFSSHANENYLVVEILEISPSPLNIDITTATAISWDSQADTTYAIQSSTDMQTWTMAVDAIEGTGERLTHFFTRSAPATFYRVEETP